MGWHHIIVRCGPNTTKDFMEKSEPGVVLGDDDIFFVDIGPIYGDTEGDAGDTFVFGSDPDHVRAKKEVRQIWDQVREEWFTNGSTGKELYDYATSVAAGYGWKLNMDLSGHRLSDFPHSAHYDGPLAEVEFRPNPNLWVLEIAIAHPDGSSAPSTRTSCSRTSRSPNDPLHWSPRRPAPHAISDTPSVGATDRSSDT